MDQMISSHLFDKFKWLDFIFLVDKLIMETNWAEIFWTVFPFISIFKSNLKFKFQNYKKFFNQNLKIRLRFKFVMCILFAVIN